MHPCIPANASLPWNMLIGEFIYTSVIPTQPEKAASPIAFIPLGTFNERLKESHPIKALSPTLKIPEFRDSLLCRLEQPEKAKSPIVVTSGKEMKPSKLLQPWKAPIPIVSTLSGIIKLPLKELHS